MTGSCVRVFVVALGLVYAAGLAQNVAHADPAAKCLAIHDRVSGELRRLSSPEGGGAINFETFQRNSAEICRVMKSEKPGAQASGCLDREDEVGRQLKNSFESFGATCPD